MPITFKVKNFSFPWAGFMPHNGPGLPKIVKKPPLTVNVIDFEIFGFYVSIWVPWSPLRVPLVPKSHDSLVELFRFTRFVKRNKVCFAQFLRFH